MPNESRLARQAFVCAHYSALSAFDIRQYRKFSIIYHPLLLHLDFGQCPRSVEVFPLIIIINARAILRAKQKEHKVMRPKRIQSMFLEGILEYLKFFT